MPDLIRINNQDITAIEYKGQRVVTFEMIDCLHERPEGTASRNFAKHRHRFIEKTHFYHIEYKELYEMRIIENPSPNGLIEDAVKPLPSGRGYTAFALQGQQISLV